MGHISSPHSDIGGPNMRRRHTRSMNTPTTPWKNCSAVGVPSRWRPVMRTVLRPAMGGTTLKTTQGWRQKNAWDDALHSRQHGEQNTSVWGGMPGTKTQGIESLLSAFVYWYVQSRYASINCNITGSDNGLSTIHCQWITQINSNIGSLEINFSEIWIWSKNNFPLRKYTWNFRL